MNKTWQIISITILVIFGTIRIVNYLSRPVGNAQIISKTYEPYWRDDAGDLHRAIKKSLKDNLISYTNYYIKRNNNSGDEVLVACTNDEEKFTYFTYYSFSGRLAQLEDDGISKPKSTNTAVN